MLVQVQGGRSLGLSLQRKHMTRFTITLRILAWVQMFIVAFTALVGSFADGGQWWERLILVGVHPAAAVLLLILVMGRNRSKKLIMASLALLTLNSRNIAADVFLYLAIGTGLTKGDAWLPLVFSVIPLIALPYCFSQLRRS